MDELRRAVRVVRVRRVELLIARSVALPQTISVKRAHLPPLKLQIDWDGEAWRHRGGVVG
jgi:hypothetical protein